MSSKGNDKTTVKGLTIVRANMSVSCRRSMFLSQMNCARCTTVSGPIQGGMRTVQMGGWVLTEIAMAHAPPACASAVCPGR